MDVETLPSLGTNTAVSRVCTISSFSTELLEMQAEEPSWRILFIPGNPAVIVWPSFFSNYSWSVPEHEYGLWMLIAAIGHISHTGKDWEHGRMFSLQEQIDHKVAFIKEKVKCSAVPIVLVGHSIGAYICLEIFKRFPQQVKFVLGLYPFLTLNRESLKQSMIGTVARSYISSAVISSLVSLLGSFPTRVLRALIRRILGQSWSPTAIDAACDHLIHYHTIRNILYMAMTEFSQLSEDPDWEFMKSKEKQISLLFGIDDHWGPLSLFEEVSRKVPGASLSIEREGHTHAFSCTKAGSKWVAHHVATLIKSQVVKCNDTDLVPFL